jgi:glycogen operon protein
MTDADWSESRAEILGVLLGGGTLDVREAYGEPVRDDTLLILLNGTWDSVVFSTPADLPEAEWEVAVDTAEPVSVAPPGLVRGGEAIELQPLSMMLLVHREIG